MAQKHRHVILFLFAIALLALHCTSSAATPQDNILDGILKSYETSSAKWFERVEPIARSLFWKLAAIEFAWSTIVWAMQQEHVQSFTVALTKKIIGIGFFYALLLNAPDWIPAIVNGFIKTGQTASNLPLLTPSAIFDLGIDTANVILRTSTSFLGIIFGDEGFLASIITGLCGILIVISFTIVAGQLMVAYIESYIIIGAGILFLGFGGSRWTTDLAQKYISYAVATGVKLLILYLLIGLAMDQAQNWKGYLEASNFDVRVLIMVMGASILLVFLSFQIPSMAAGMLSGAPSLTAGAAASTGAAVGAGVIAGGGRAISAATSAAQGGVGSAVGIGKAIQAGSAYASAAGPSTPFAGLKTAAGDWGREAAATASRSVQGLSSGGGSIGSRAAANRNAMTAGMMGSAPPQSTAMTAAAEGKSAPGAGAVPQVSPPGAGGAGRAPDRLSGESALGSAAANPTALNISDSTKSAGATHAAPASEAAGAVESRSLSAEKMRQATSASGAGISEPSHAPDRLSGEGGLGSAQPNETAINVSDSNQAADTTHAAPAPEASAAPQFSSASASSGAPRQASPPSPQEQPQRQRNMFEGIEQVRPPQIPHDAAPTVGANFRTDLGGE